MSIKSELKKTASHLRNARKAIIGRGGDISLTAGLKDLPDAIFNIPADASLAFYTDEETAYRKTVPTGAEEYALLSSLGGMTHKCNNLLDGSKFVEGSFSVRGITYSYDADTQIYTINGIMDSSGNIAMKRINIKGKKDSTYIVRTEVVGGSATVPSGGYALVYFGSADSTTGAYTNWLDCGVRTSQAKSKVLPHEYIAQAWFYFTQGVVFDNLQVKIMLAKTSDTTLPYEPFYEGLRDSKVTEIKSRDTDGNVIAIRPIPEEIQVGKGVNGYADTIDFDAKKRTQRVNTVVLTGNEQYSAGGYYFITNNINCPKGAGATTMIHTESYPMSFSNTQHNNFQFGSGGDSIFNYFADVNEFKAHLAERYASGNPVTIIYALEEPIEIDISAELEGFDNIIEVGGGGSLEFVNEYKNAVPSTMNYVIKVGS
jgi:hypothetical protein